MEKIHEINGKKFIINEDPNMVRVEEYRIGDQVMVLKKGYGESYTMCPGVIIAFFDFQMLPSLHVAYLNVEYSSAKIEFQAFNANTKDVEFCRYEGKDLPYGKDRVLTLLDNEIEKKRDELRDIEHKKQYFVECFGKFFSHAIEGEIA